MSVHQICEKIGISQRRMLRYRQKLGEHKHTSNRTTEEKIDSTAKALVTKQRNAEKKFLTERGRRNLSVAETQKWLDAWDREHAGIESTPVSGTPSAVSGTV